MQRNRSLSFYHKKREKNENTLRTKATSQVKVNESECSTFPRNTKQQFSDSSPLLTKLLGDLEGNPIFRQQKQKNGRSKSIDFLTTKPVISSYEPNYQKTEKVEHKGGSYRKSFSANNLTVS